MTGDGIIFAHFKALDESTSLKNCFLIWPRIQNWIWKQEMELYKYKIFFISHLYDFDKYFILHNVSY